MDSTQERAGRLQVSYYTDPLCCWSWGFEPQWRKLLMQYGSVITWKYIMGGLIPDWKSYHDTEHSVSKPIQMGPVWMHAAQVTGMPMNSLLWMKAPPASSYPACIAFKCVELQSPAAAEIYLRLLREAVMIAGENIADKGVLIALAAKLVVHVPTFDCATFEKDVVSDTGIEAFRKDLLATQSRRVERFPTLIFKQGSKAMIMTGYQPYNSLSAVMEKFGIRAADKKREQPAWYNATQREAAELGLLHV